MVSHIINKRRYEKRGKQDERKSSEEISDGGNVCGLGDRSSDGIPYDSECGKYFFAYAHSGIDLRSALWMAVWADMWDFSACIIQSVYRNASGCILPAMLCELAVYGLITGICVYGIHTEKQIVKIYGSLITAMLAGRIVSGILKALIFNVGEYSFKIFITSSFLTGIPGILIQLIFIPVIVLALQKAGIAEPKRR